MRSAAHTTIFSLLALVMTPFLSPAAHADIIGFTPGSYQYNYDDTGSPPVIGDDSIQLTTGEGQHRSIFFSDRQDITGFTASFTYHAGNVGTFGNSPAIAFVLQDHADGAHSLGGGRAAYEEITHSAAVTIEYNSNVDGSFSGFFTGGVVGSGSASTAPLNAYNGDDIGVTITYSGSVLSVLFEDLDTGSVFNSGPLLVGSLASTIGSPTAFVGFTAASDDGANHYLSNFRFTSAVPAPGTGLLMAGGMLAASRRRRAR